MNSDHKNAFLKAFTSKHNLDAKDCAVIRHRAADGTTVGYKIRFPDGAETLAFTPEEIHRYTDQWYAERRAIELAEFEAVYSVATKAQFQEAMAEASDFIHRNLVTQEFRNVWRSNGYDTAGVHGVLTFILAQKGLKVGPRDYYIDK